MRLRNEFLNQRILLRVCGAKSEHPALQSQLNCSRCEKCLGTIASLLLARIDPNTCGFQVDASTFELMRFILVKKLLPRRYLNVWWKPIQRNIPEQISYDLCGSRSFFEWLKDVRMDSYAAKYHSTRYRLYKILPYWIFSFAKNAFYDRMSRIRFFEPIQLPTKPVGR